jgi:hypothetical protein
LNRVLPNRRPHGFATNRNLSRQSDIYRNQLHRTMTRQTEFTASIHQQFVSARRVCSPEFSVEQPSPRLRLAQGQPRMRSGRRSASTHSPFDFPQGRLIGGYKYRRCGIAPGRSSPCLDGTHGLVFAELPGKRPCSIRGDGRGDVIPTRQAVNRLELYSVDLSRLLHFVIFVSLESEHVWLLPADRLGVFMAENCVLEFSVARPPWNVA